MDDSYLQWQRDEFLIRLRLEAGVPVSIVWSDGTAMALDADADAALELRFKPLGGAPPSPEVLRAIVEQRFADAYVSVERPDDGPRRILVNVDLPAMVGWFLSRTEEVQADCTDEHGRFPFEKSLLVQHGLHMRPVVDLAVEQLADVLLAESRAAGTLLSRWSPWPAGKRYAVALTHDVDFVANRPVHLVCRKLAGGLLQLTRGKIADALWRWQEMGSAALMVLGLRRRCWPIEQLTALEESHDVRSTFFIMSLAEALVNEAGQTVRHYTTDETCDAFRQARERGHEIGVHGAYDATSADQMVDQRRRLIEALGEPIAGHRHHFLRCRVPDQLRSYEQAGFAYDASLGWSRDAGVRSGTMVPYVPYDLQRDRPLALHEVGVHLMDTAILNHGGAEAHLQRFEQLQADARRTSGLLVLLYHPVESGPFQSGVCRDAYTAILDRLQADPEAYVAPAGDVFNTWRAAVLPCRCIADPAGGTDSV